MADEKPMYPWKRAYPKIREDENSTFCMILCCALLVMAVIIYLIYVQMTWDTGPTF